MPGFLHGFSGSELRSSYLQGGKHYHTESSQSKKQQFFFVCEGDQVKSYGNLIRILCFVDIHSQMHFYYGTLLVCELLYLSLNLYVQCLHLVLWPLPIQTHFCLIYIFISVPPQLGQTLQSLPSLLHKDKGTTACIHCYGQWSAYSFSFFHTLCDRKILPAHYSHFVP